MTIKRYIASADTTITNAYKANLTTRGTGSNMGESDILEVFSIFGHASTSSVEKSRALINFPISTITADRTSGDLPESGSVKFFLKVFNCPHGQTLPKQFDLAVLPISRSWDEGRGLDMEEYTDKDVANWEVASNTKQPNITDIKVLTTVDSNLRQKYFSLYNADNKRYNFWFQQSAGAGFSGSLPGQEVLIPLTGSTLAGGVYTARNIARAIRQAINNANQPAAATDARAHSPLGLSASISFEDTGDTSNVTVRVTTTGSQGQSGSFQGNLSTDHITVTTVQQGGRVRWTNEGGDYHEVGYTAGKNLPHYSKTFTKGTENLEINITAMVEEWLASKTDGDTDREAYGIMLKLSGSYEDGTRDRSYYTKKFFARGSEFFYKRPLIEARWDDSISDDRGNFFMSSSLVLPEDNLNRLYLYNVVKGRLRDIPVLRLKTNVAANTGSAQHYNTKIYLQIFPSGNIKNAAVAAALKPKTLPIGGGVTGNNHTTVTGSWVSTGIYSASFAFTGSEKEVFDVWSAGPNGNDQLVTGSTLL